MLREEAVWIRTHLESLDPERIYPMCNLGSATLHFRTVEQPYIDSEVFAQARSQRGEVVHVDMQAATGVDLVGDLSDENFATTLRQRRFQSVMCCNILEHVVDRRQFADLVLSLIEPGGYIVVTIPNRYPYHAYPIDTMFRPNIGEAAALFPGTEIISAEIVYASAILHDINGDWRRALWLALRICLPVYRPTRWVASVRYVLQLWRGYRVTCVILRQPPTKSSLC